MNCMMNITEKVEDLNSVKDDKGKFAPIVNGKGIMMKMEVG